MPSARGSDLSHGTRYGAHDTDLPGFPNTHTDVRFCVFVDVMAYLNLIKGLLQGRKHVITYVRVILISH